MNTISTQGYRGTRDFFPADQRIQDFMFKKMHEVAKLFGYQHYNGPLLEEVELYKAKSGEELINEQIYSFTDRGNRFVAIRPEMTPTLARMIAQCHREVPKPIRWYSIPNLMRYEKPQKGRLREHWQFNCDIFGAKDRRGELEILDLVVWLLTSFGADKTMFSIQINDRNIVDFVFNTLFNLDQERSHKLYKLLDQFRKIDESAFLNKLDLIGLSEENKNLFSEYLSINSFDQLVRFLKKYNYQDETFFKFIKDLSITKAATFVQFDPTIVRGLDYYTGIVFEIYDLNPQNARAICGGGAYENLLKIFNEDSVPGVGFGLGDVTLLEFLRGHNLLPDFLKPQYEIFIAVLNQNGIDLAYEFADKLRSQNMSVVVHPETINFKKSFSLAEKYSCKTIALINENEINEKKMTIKNLQTKEQIEVFLNDFSQLKKIL
jgi:histidyl-tRNA synthetase